MARKRLMPEQVVNLLRQVEVGIANGNGRFAYVSVSRAFHDAQIFTNDAGNLAQSLSKDASKTSVVEFTKTHFEVPNARQERLEIATTKLGTGLSLGL